MNARNIAAICPLPWSACGGGSSGGEERGRPARESPTRYGPQQWRWPARTGFAALPGHCPSSITALKKRVEQAVRLLRGEGRESGPRATLRGTATSRVPPGACDCTLELEDTAGSKMRVHLKAATPPDLTALCRSFWNPAP